jgi:hypothetical protein
MTQQRSKELELLKQLIGDWSVGIAMKTPDGKIVSGCGEMNAAETESGINSEVNTQIEGYEDYYENDIWSFDETKEQVHLFSVTSDGEFRDHIGKWKDDNTLELNWRGTFEDQEQEEHIIARWVTKDQIELRETHYSQDKPVLTIDYVFKKIVN